MVALHTLGGKLIAYGIPRRILLAFHDSKPLKSEQNYQRRGEVCYNSVVDSGGL